MAVPVRRTDGGRPLEVWEPLGTGPWDPVAEMRELTERFSRLVNQLTGQWPTDGLLPGGSAPLGELEEQDDAYLVRVELPGVKQGDIDVELAGRLLTVRAERKETQRKGLLRRSTRRTGEFFFEALLPGEVDQAGIQATLEAGVLAVRLPKPESERRKTRKITIR
jgi:HSP20 family protein